MSDNQRKKRKDPFSELMKPLDQFFQEKPVKGFLQSIDELFQNSFPVAAPFHIDLSETNDEYIIVAELPGIKRDQIKINVLENYVTVSVQATEAIIEEDENRKIYRRQQSLQQSSRTIPLPQPINEKRANASYKDGLLRINVPKLKGKRILLNDGE